MVVYRSVLIKGGNPTEVRRVDSSPEAPGMVYRKALISGEMPTDVPRFDETTAGMLLDPAIHLCTHCTKACACNAETNVSRCASGLCGEVLDHSSNLRSYFVKAGYEPGLELLGQFDSCCNEGKCGGEDGGCALAGQIYNLVVAIHKKSRRTEEEKNIGYI